MDEKIKNTRTMVKKPPQQGAHITAISFEVDLRSLIGGTVIIGRDHHGRGATEDAGVVSKLAW